VTPGTDEVLYAHSLSDRGCWAEPPCLGTNGRLARWENSWPPTLSPCPVLGRLPRA